MALSLPIDPGANELLSGSPLALLIAMLLDQQVPLEKAFGSPYVLMQRLGHEPTAAELADYDPDALAAVFSERPALHRYPRAMAGRTQELARAVVERYDGYAGRIWLDAADGADLLRRLSELPGYGTYKAQILMALLGKQLGVQPEGWREAAGPVRRGGLALLGGRRGGQGVAGRGPRAQEAAESRRGGRLSRGPPSPRRPDSHLKTIGRSGVVRPPRPSARTTTAPGPPASASRRSRSRRG